MIDRTLIGHVFPERVVDVEAGQLRFFAEATGETNPIYFDLDAARQAGHPTLPAPPTFLFSLELLSKADQGILDLIGADISRALHGEQHFQPGDMIYAGDRLTIARRIVDIYDKKGGALEFVVQETEARAQDGRKVATGRTISVIRDIGAQA